MSLIETRSLLYRMCRDDRPLALYAKVLKFENMCAIVCDNTLSGENIVKFE